MAHFAKLNDDNEVVQVLVVNNDVILNADNTESEYKGKVFLNSLFGNATWVQTSYNGNIRKQCAGIGYTYDSTNDVFIVEHMIAIRKDLNINGHHSRVYFAVINGKITHSFW